MAFLMDCFRKEWFDSTTDTHQVTTGYVMCTTPLKKSTDGQTTKKDGLKMEHIGFSWVKSLEYEGGSFLKRRN